MRAEAVLPAGTWDVAAEIDRVLIDFDRRHRRRILLRTEQGREVLLDLPQAVRLRDGDGLAVDGRVVRVCAKPEPLLEIHAHEEGELVRIAWHLGNRHLPVQLLGDRIRIRADHVIREMVEGLGRPRRSDRGAVRSGGGRLCWRAIIITMTNKATMQALPLRLREGVGGRGRRRPLQGPLPPAPSRKRRRRFLLPHCCGCLPGSPRHSLPAPTHIRTGWNGPWNAVTSRTATHCAYGLRMCCCMVPVEMTQSCFAMPTAPGDYATLNDFAVAIAPSRERRTETLDQGTAFIAAAAPWHPPELPERVAYPVAVGALAGRHGIGEDITTAAYLQAFIVNLISAAVRLVPLGQSTGLRVLASLEPTILHVAAESRAATLDDLGGCAFRSDLAAMRHETQYTRLFRS